MKASAFNAIMFRKGMKGFFSPPFDTIDARQREALRAVEYNITHLTLPESDEAAEQLFNSWMESGVLHRSETPLMLAILQEFEHAGKKEKRVGVICLIDVFPPGNDIKPHELTFAGPRKGRYQLMRTMGCIPEPIFLITPAPSLSFELKRIMEGRTPDIVFDEPAGVRNSIYIIAAGQDTVALSQAVSGSDAIVADGHHRLGAVREIAAERMVDGDSSWNRMLAYVAPSADNSMLIGGTHRLVQGEAPSNDALLPYFEIDDVTERAADGCILIYDGKLRRLKLRQTGDGRIEGADPSVPTDVANRVIFAKCMGMVQEDIESRVRYTHDEAAARSAVDEGRAGFCLIMPDWDPLTFTSIVAGGGLLPQKSTYFYPKIPSGIALHKP